MWKGHHLLSKYWRIHGECSAGLIDEFFAVGGGAAAKENDSLKVLTPYGTVETCTAGSADAVRALNNERQKWQDAALGGRLPDVLPKQITPETMAAIDKKMESGNLISLLINLPGPYMGGKYAEIAAVGLLDDFENAVCQSWLVKRSFHDVDWWCISDDADTWIQASHHIPGGAFIDMLLDADVANLVMAMVSPYLVVNGQDRTLTVEDMVHKPFMGIGYAEVGDQPEVEPHSEDKSIEEWITLGEIVVPVMPVDMEEWKHLRVETGASSEIKTEQLEADWFALDSSQFLELIVKHQKACNRFAHGLFALNFAKEG